MKRLQPPKMIRLADVAIGVVTIATVGFGIVQWQSEKAEALCQKPGVQHEVIIKDGAFQQLQLVLRQCDIITVVSQDKALYQLAFGTKGSHMGYPGYTEQLLGYNESLSIDAFEAGTFEVHDHLADKARITLVIQPKEQ